MPCDSDVNENDNNNNYTTSIFNRGNIILLVTVDFTIHCACFVPS